MGIFYVMTFIGYAVAVFAFLVLVMLFTLPFEHVVRFVVKTVVAVILIGFIIKGSMMAYAFSRILQ